MKIKTKNQTYEVTNIYENTPKVFGAYYKGYWMEVTKEPREKTYYVQCTHPDGCYIYDGYFHGTRLEAIKDVFKNIEIE
jgi:hypothetical protein